MKGWFNGREEKKDADNEGAARSGSSRLYGGQNDFALSMLKTVTKHNQQSSLIFSPHSTYRALLLAYFGAEGETKQSLKGVMHMDWAENENDVTDAYKAELMTRSTRFADQRLQFNSVDRLYVSQETELK